MANMQDEPRHDQASTRLVSGLPLALRSAIGTIGLSALFRLPPELYDALASEHRRAILAYLHDGDGCVTVRELADHLVTERIETDGKRAEVVLRHSHLPKLAGQGLVEWTPSDDIVVLGCIA